MYSIKIVFRKVKVAQYTLKELISARKDLIMKDMVICNKYICEKAQNMQFLREETWFSKPYFNKYLKTQKTIALSISGSVGQ